MEAFRLIVLGCRVGTWGLRAMAGVFFVRTLRPSARKKGYRLTVSHTALPFGEWPLEAYFKTGPGGTADNEAVALFPC